MSCCYNTRLKRRESLDSIIWFNTATLLCSTQNIQFHQILLLSLFGLGGFGGSGEVVFLWFAILLTVYNNMKYYRGYENVFCMQMGI